MKKLIRTKSLSEQVSDAIHHEIVSGGFELGQMLSETMIAEKLGVSRTPVREAFSHLEQNGLVETIPKKGTFIFKPTADEVQDIFEVSGGLELQGLKLSIKRNGTELAEECRKIWAAMEREASDNREAEYQQSNVKLHQAFVAYSGNQLLIDLHNEISGKVKALAAASIYVEKLNDLTHKCHQNVVESIIGSDEHMALTHFSDHIKKW